jgi:hypothetical protein
MAATIGQSKHFVFAGSIVDRDDEHLAVRHFPAATLELRLEDVVRVEEATDASTMRSYVWIELRPEAELDANFRPRLARRAAGADAVPFSLGGFAETTRPHGLPSGGAPSIPPLLDVGGLAAFAGVIPAETEEELRKAAERPTPVAKRTKYETKSKTPSKTNKPTSSRTTDPDTGAFHIDEGDDTEEVDDEIDDTAQDDKFDW